MWSGINCHGDPKRQGNLVSGDTQSFTGHSPEQPDLMLRLAPAGAGAGIPANLDCSLLLGFTGQILCYS